MPFLQFPSLNASREIAHGFTLRSPEEDDVGELKKTCELLGVNYDRRVEAAQPHGARTATVGPSHAGKRIPNVDALITSVPEIPLVIRTADCAPVFLLDPDKKVIGLIHSGRRGTEQNIAANVVQVLQEQFASRAEDLKVVIGPSIRPPQYDIDFVQKIKDQFQACGIRDIADCGENTGNDLTKFYSYRMERGETGRHYSILALTGAGASTG